MKTKDKIEIVVGFNPAKARCFFLSSKKTGVESFSNGKAGFSVLFSNCRVKVCNGSVRLRFADIFAICVYFRRV